MNSNGMIEFNEFLQMMSLKLREGNSEDELKEAFKWVIFYKFDIITIIMPLHTFNVSRCGIFFL